KTDGAQPDRHLAFEGALINHFKQLCTRHARHNSLDVHQQWPGLLRWQGHLKTVSELHLVPLLSLNTCCYLALRRCASLRNNVMGTTGSAVIAPGMPSALSTAAAMAAPAALVPPSPAPFRPNGFNGLGASSVIITSISGISCAVTMV